MPINIKPGESEQEFISRCIGDEVSSGKDQEQSAAICYSYWRKETNMSTQSKVASKLRQDAWKGINIVNLGENSDACWDNYIQVGTKILDGKEVPDCRGPIEEE